MTHRSDPRGRSVRPIVGLSTRDLSHDPPEGHLRPLRLEDDTRRVVAERLEPDDYRNPRVIDMAVLIAAL